MPTTTTTNRIDHLFETKKNNILSIYFTAGFPKLEDTVSILQYLQEAGADMVEIGIPFSDPVADGPTIQHSSTVALRNGMTLNLLFEQIKNIRKSVHIPLLLMGYLNPVMQYGMEKFCQKCQETGIDGLIIPDLPLQEYMDEYKTLFEQYGLYNIFLISPQTSEERIRQIDQHSSGFIYMVSSASITGAKGSITDEQVAYFKRVAQMGLNNPSVIGFGISNHETFERACTYASGAIIGSAFVNLLKESKNLKEDIKQFVRSVKGG
jgi:tryptophan synthase alpha chain